MTTEINLLDYYTPEEIQQKMCEMTLVFFGNFFKTSKHEKRLNMLDLTVYSVCFNCFMENKKVDVKEISKELGKKQITISASLRRLKAVNAINKDFIPTNKFLDTSILEEIKNDPHYVRKLKTKSS